jgi:hypothetical protein
VIRKVKLFALGDLDIADIIMLTLKCEVWIIACWIEECYSFIRLRLKRAYQFVQVFEKKQIKMSYIEEVSFGKHYRSPKKLAELEISTYSQNSYQTSYIKN